MVGLNWGGASWYKFLLTVIPYTVHIDHLNLGKMRIELTDYGCAPIHIFVK